MLNDTTTVSSELADRVRRAASEIGYQPFGPARALRLRRTPVWSVIVADIENPFFTSVVRGVEDIARDREYRVLLGNSDEDLAGRPPTSTRPSPSTCPASSSPSPRPPTASSANCSTRASPWSPSTGARRGNRSTRSSSTTASAPSGGAHLLEAGYRRIACVTGPSRLSTAVERFEGYAEAMRRSGAAGYERTLVRRANFKQDGGYRAALALLQSAEPPDSFFVANNLMTLGVLEAIREMGLVIGRDVGVVGFDDAPWAPLVEPALTVVAQPARKIGQQAALLLADGPGDERREVVLSPALVVRNSTTR